MSDPDTTTEAPSTGRETAEHWRDQEAKAKVLHPGGFNAAEAYLIAKAHNTWPIGRLLTQAEYEDAVAAALNAPIGSSKTLAPKRGV